MPLIQKKLKITGRVQGVGFRASTVAAAQRISGGELKGYVRNLPDGSVETVISGEQSFVDQLVDWCHHGPDYARVEQVTVDDMPIDSALKVFGITH